MAVNKSIFGRRFLSVTVPTLICAINKLKKLFFKQQQYAYFNFIGSHPIAGNKTLHLKPVNQ